MTSARLATYSDRLLRPTSEKISDFANRVGQDVTKSDDIKHLILSEQLTPTLLSRLFVMATAIRKLQETKSSSDALRQILSHKRAMLFFSQPSTRTYISFVSACQLLGMPYTEIRDPRVSSEAKGEDIFDALRMFAANNDVIIMRSQLANLSECAAYMMNDLEIHSKHRALPIVNGGSGADEHPTQALLDMYTVNEAFNEAFSPEVLKADSQERPSLEDTFANKSYVFVGDIGRGRTVRSLSVLLAKFSGARLIFVAPDHPTLKLPSETRAKLEASGAQVEETTNLHAALPHADMLYMTRIQNEHDDSEIKAFYDSHDLTRYHLESHHLNLLPKHAIILHPFPRNREINVSVDADPRARYFIQAQNGMWTRAALLAHVFGAESEVLRLFKSYKTAREAD